MKYQLTPVDTDFVVRTTTLEFHASELAPLVVTLDVEPADAPEPYTNIRKEEIVFPVFARMEHVMVNFWEFNYQDFEINTSTKDNRGLYIINNSQWDTKQLDPLQRLQLRHFLIVGYDSYLEVLAQPPSEFRFSETVASRSL